MIFFYEPFPAKCGERMALPKKHLHCGGPQEWFAQESLQRQELYGLSFDFFVDWSQASPSLSPVIWIKKLLSKKHDYAQVQRHLNTIMAIELGETYLGRLHAFKMSFNIEIQFIIFHDDCDWNLKDSSLLITTLNESKNNAFDFSGEIVSIQHFKSKIKAHSGGPIRIGSKGLTYGTSALECFLSNTSSLYPGDVDLIIFNNSNQPVAILEYKKHTLKSSISNQQLSNYYPRPDGKKYNRLAILRDFLGKPKAEIPLLVVYFPTQQGTSEGRLEFLKGKPEHLETEKALNFNLPTAGSSSDYAVLIKMLLKEIENHDTSD